MAVPETLQPLKTELANDPVSLGYAAIRSNGGLSARQKAEQMAALLLDATKRTKSRGVVNRTLIMRRLNAAEYVAACVDATNGARNQHLLLMVLSDDIDVNDPNVASIFTTVFGAGSQTVRNFIGHASADDPWKGDDLRLSKLSRSAEAGIAATVADIEFCEAN